MNDKHIIQIAGKKRSGKDTTAEILQELTPGSEIISFAGPMKEIISKVFKISEYQLNYAKDNGKIKAFLKFWNPIFLLVDFRDVLQQFGSEIMKPIFGDTVWVDVAKKKIEKSRSDTIIISDWRFPEEIIDGSTTIRVIRKGLISTDTHVSETMLNDTLVDHEIENDGTLRELGESVFEVFAELEDNKAREL